MAVEFCPKCQSPRNMSVSTSVREQTQSEGKIKRIMTKSYQCDVCHGFVRSEDFEVTDDDSTGDAATLAPQN